VKLVEVFLVLLYNLSLLAGASYLIIVYDFSAWIYLLALLFAASWKDKDEKRDDDKIVIQ
jgi:hypothetical protein